MKFINLSYLNRLNRREKYYVTAAALVIAVFLVFQLVISPISNKREVLERGLAEKTEALQEMLSLQSEYFELEKTNSQATSELARRDKKFDLRSSLNRMAKQVGIDVKSVDPSSREVNGVKIATARVVIKTTTMELFTKYLHQIEYSGDSLRISSMIISRTSKPEGYINVDLKVETIVS